MQSRYHPEPLTGLTAWVATRAQPLVERWKNRERRTAVEEQLQKLAAQGFLAPMLALLRDRTGHEADSEGLRVAVADLTRLEAALLYIRDGSEDRATIAARLGQEIAAGIGLAAVAATLIMTALR